MQSRLIGWLENMQTAMRLTLSYVDGMDRQAFFADTRTQQAVSMNLIILGEAASKVIESFPAMMSKYPEVPWNSIKGMRNRIAHGYFEIDLDVVWQTVRRSLPTLREQLELIIAAVDAGDADSTARSHQDLPENPSAG